MVTAVLYYAPKLLEPGEFKQAFESAAAAVLGEEVEVTSSFRRYHAGISDAVTVDAEGLRNVVDLSKIDLSVTGTAKPKKNDVFARYAMVSLSNYQGAVQISASGDLSVRCLDALVARLG